MSVRRNSMTSILPNTAVPDVDVLPRIYHHHPSRPLPSALRDAPDANQRAPAHIAVVVAFLSPLSSADAHKIHDLQHLRKRWDQAYPRWLPHLTLIPPFTVPWSDPALIPEPTQLSSAETDEGTPVSPRQREIPEPAHGTPSTGPTPSALQSDLTLRQVRESLDQLGTTLSAVCSLFPQHVLPLDEVGTFPLRGYTNVHLRPRSTHRLGNDVGERGLEIVRLQKALVGALPREVGAGREGGRHRGAENRAARRGRERADVAGKGITQPGPGEQASAPVDGPGVSPGVSAHSDANPRSYSRPLYRSGVIDEARCVTFPTVEVHPPRPDSGGPTPRTPVVREPVNDGRGTPDHPVPSGDEDQRQRDDQTTATPPRITQEPTPAARREFIPHASVGQARGPRERHRLLGMAQAVLQGAGEVSPDGQEPTRDARRVGIDCWVDRVYLLTKPVGKGGPYEVYSVAYLRDEGGVGPT